MMSEANTFAQRVYFDLLYLSTMQYWMKRHTYLVMVLLLIIFETIHIVIGYWSGDFWQHAAVVNELSKDLLHPRNPMIDADIPHAFYSPYSLLVAKFAQLTHTGSINALSYFAFFNLVFFFSLKIHAHTNCIGFGMKLCTDHIWIETDSHECLGIWNMRSVFFNT